MTGHAYTYLNAFLPGHNCSYNYIVLVNFLLPTWAKNASTQTKALV